MLGGRRGTARADRVHRRPPDGHLLRGEGLPAGVHGLGLLGLLDELREAQHLAVPQRGERRVEEDGVAEDGVDHLENNGIQQAHEA